MRSFEDFLSPGDAARVCQTLEKLRDHGLDNFAITGSIALELQLLARAKFPVPRALNDIDLVVQSFNSLPSSLAKKFLVRHAHPQAPEGKMVIQLVDERLALRIDVFRAYGQTLARSQSISLDRGTFQVVSLEDLAARMASLVMGLEHGGAVTRKHAEDFARLSASVACDAVELAWQDHRKPTDPVDFREACRRVSKLAVSHRHLLIIPEYSQDLEARCPKCTRAEGFPLTPAQAIKSILGYC